MTLNDRGVPADPTRPSPISAAKLWAGGIATAVVAALVAAVGVVISEGVLSIDLLHLGLPANPDAPNIVAYPAVGFLLALAATGVLHLLAVLVPQPVRFFTWIIALVAVLAAALPFATGLTARTFVTSAVNLLTVLAIWILLSSTGYRARRAAQQTPRPPETGPPRGTP